MKTEYTHRARVIAIGKGLKCESYTATLRKVGKWWETKTGRRFDKFGNEIGYDMYPKCTNWRIDMPTLRRITK